MRRAKQAAAVFGVCVAACLALVAHASPSTAGAANGDLERTLQDTVRRHGWPGAAVLFEGSDSATVTAAAGLAAIEERKPMSPTTGFHICSINKIMTAVAVLRLVDQGKLSLDRKLLTVLDGAVVRRIPHAAEITVGQLLDHSSGIYATNNDPDYIRTLVGSQAFTARVWSPEELVELATRPENPPQAKPGEGHHYADTNYVLLGMIVERVSGEPFKAHLARTLFAPLAMTSTYFYSDVLQGRATTPSHVAQGYIRMSKELAEAVEMNPAFGKAGGDLINTSIAAERIDAAGGIVSTLPDLHRFARPLFRGEVLSPASQAWLMSVGRGMDGVEPGRKRIRALRAVNTDFGLVVFKEGDGPGGFNTLMAHHPESGAIFLGFTNHFGNFDEVDVMMNEVMGSRVAAPSSADAGATRR